MESLTAHTFGNYMLYKFKPESVIINGLLLNQTNLVLPIFRTYKI